MEYVYTALLLHKAGKKVNAASVKKVLEAAGVKPDASRIKALLAALEGVNIDEAVKKSVAVPVAAAAPSGEAPKAEEKKAKPEEKEEVSEAETAQGLGALFG